jgi:hypothetical protein
VNIEPPPPPPAAAEIRHHGAQHGRTGQWELTVRRDDFAGQVRCHLRGRRMSVERTAMVFQLPGGRNTFDAAYRIDDAPAVSWRVNAMTLAADGVQFNHADLNNPSRGRVAIPLALLDGAGSVTIRATPGAPPARFDLHDLPAAVMAMRAAGCPTAAPVQHAQ